MMASKGGQCFSCQSHDGIQRGGGGGGGGGQCFSCQSHDGFQRGAVFLMPVT